MSDSARKGTKIKFFISYDMIFDTSLSIYAKMVYQFICRCADKQSQSFPSHKTIAEKCSCGVTKVKEAIKELVDAKLLVKQNRYRKTSNGKLTQTSNLYIIYDRPYDTISLEELEDISVIDDEEEIILDYPGRITATPQSCNDQKSSRNTTTPKSPDDYISTTFLSTTQFEGKSIYQSTNEENLIEGLNSIFENCNLNLYDKSVKDSIINSITDMYFAENFSKKTGIPKVIIQQRLLSMDMQSIDRALANYKSAVDSGIEVTAPMKYFQKCIWTAINDDRLDLLGIS